MKTSQRHRDKALRRVNYAEEALDDLAADIISFHEAFSPSLQTMKLAQAEETALALVALLKAAKRLLDSSIVAEESERREGASDE